jgi:hypothetical protein
MYLQIFRSQEPPAIPPEVTYTVEHLVCQILTTAAPVFLQAARERRRLAQALFEELEFFGQVPKRYLPEVKAYLMKQERSLREAAKRVLKDPENVTLREQLCQPLSAPSA